VGVPIRYRQALIALLAIGITLFPVMRTPAHAGSSALASRTVTATAHGVTLSLTVPARVYPRNALVRVTATARNVSNHPLGISTLDAQHPINGTTVPQVQVLDFHGHPVYPPALQYCCAIPGSPFFPIPLQPGQTRRLHAYVVLRAGRLRAAVDSTSTPQDPVARYRLTTPSLTVSLRKPDPPRVTLQEYRENPPRPLAATFTPRRSPHGSLLYMEWMDCLYFSGSAQLQRTGVVLWTRTSNDWATVRPDGAGIQIAPHCPPEQQASPHAELAGSLVQWHVIAGWPNHSARVFDYPSGWINPDSIKP
jgi:hypothetical protein